MLLFPIRQVSLSVSEVTLVFIVHVCPAVENTVRPQHLSDPLFDYVSLSHLLVFYFHLGFSVLEPLSSLAMGASIQTFWIWIFVLQEIQPFFLHIVLFSPFVWVVFLQPVTCVAQVYHFWLFLKLLNVLLDAFII